VTPSDCMIQICTACAGVKRLENVGELLGAIRNFTGMGSMCIPQNFGHGCDGCGCGAAPCCTVMDHYPIPRYGGIPRVCLIFIYLFYCFSLLTMYNKVHI
jgi:hypothetical protein